MIKAIILAPWFVWLLKGDFGHSIEKKCFCSKLTWLMDVFYFILLSFGGWGLNPGLPTHSASTLPTELTVAIPTSSHGLSALGYSGTSKCGCYSHLAEGAPENSKSCVLDSVDRFQTRSQLEKKDLLFDLTARTSILLPLLFFCNKKLHTHLKFLISSTVMSRALGRGR